MSASGCDLSDEHAEKLVHLFYDNSIITNYKIVKNTLPWAARSEAINMAERQNFAMKEAGKLLNQQQMDVLRQYWNGYINSNLTEEEKNNPSEARKKMLSESTKQGK